MKKRTKEEMAEYQKWRLRAAAPENVTPVTPAVLLRLAVLEKEVLRISDLEDRIWRLENPEEVSRKQVLKPGAHPAELYGA